MSSKNTTYDVWTDGSYRGAHNAGGAGWLIRNNGEEQEGYKAAPVLKGGDKVHGSDVAEVFAVVCALRTIPEGSSVFLRLDCQNVCDWIKRREITTSSKKQVMPLQSLFSEAVSLIDTMKDCSVSRVSGNSNASLNRVHQLSKIASNPKK